MPPLQPVAAANAGTTGGGAAGLPNKWGCGVYRRCPHMPRPRADEAEQGRQGQTDLFAVGDHHVELAAAPNTNDTASHSNLRGHYLHTHRPRTTVTMHTCTHMHTPAITCVHRH